MSREQAAVERDFRATGAAPRDATGAATRCDPCKGSGLIKASLFGAPSGWSVCISCDGIGYIRQPPKLTVWNPQQFQENKT